MAVAVIKLAGESRRVIERSRLRGDTLIKALPAAAQKAGTLLANRISRDEFGPGKTLNVITSQLRSSVAARVLGSGASLAVMVGVTKGPAAQYAAVHERGGVIRAKSGRALAVPLDGAKTPGGRSRTPAEMARKYPDMFMLKRPGKPPLLVRPLRVKGQPGGRIREFEPLFVLVKSVKIPARHWLSGGVRRGFDVFHLSLRRDVQALLEAK